MYRFQQADRYLHLFGRLVELIFGKACDPAYFTCHHPHMAYRLYHIPRARFSFGTDHGCAFGDPAQGFTKVLCTAHERNVKFCFIDMVNIVRRRKHFAFIDIINLDGLKNLCFCEMADPYFCHDRNAYCLLNPADHFWIAHAGYAARGANIRRDTLERHYRTCPCVFRDLCLFGRSYVHDDPAFEHLSQILVQFISFLCHFLNPSFR